MLRHKQAHLRKVNSAICSSHALNSGRVSALNVFLAGIEGLHFAFFD